VLAGCRPEMCSLFIMSIIQLCRSTFFPRVSVSDSAYKIPFTLNAVDCCGVHMRFKSKYPMIYSSLLYLFFIYSGSEVISSYSSSSSSSSIMAESVIQEMPPAMCLEKASVDFCYVGIDAILEQMRRKAMKQGFELNIMVVGESTFQR